MKIKTRLKIGTFLSISIALIISGILFLASQQVNEAVNNGKTIDKALKGLYELRTVTDDYLLHHESRAQVQWQLKHDTLEKLLLRLTFKNLEEQNLVEKINQYHGEIKSLFSRLVENYERQKLSEENVLYRELEERVTGQLKVKLQRMVSGAFKLDEINDAKVVAVQKTANLFIMVFVLVVVGSIGTGSFLLSQTIVKPIIKLKDASVEIGMGKLDTQAEIKSKDEIGELAQAFNKMVENRSKVMAASDAAQQQLEASNQQLKASNQQLKAGEQQLQSSYQRLLINEQQLKAANQQLKAANDETLRAKSVVDEKIVELERFHKVTVGRELEMVRLKKEINELLEKLGQPKKYATAKDTEK